MNDPNKATEHIWFGLSPPEHLTEEQANALRDWLDANRGRLDALACQIFGAGTPGADALAALIPVPDDEPEAGGDVD